MAGLAGEEDSGDFGDWQEEFEETAKCLISNKVFPSAAEAIASTESLGFDFSQATKGRGAYDRMKIINYVRKRVAEGVTSSSVLFDEVMSSDAWRCDKFLAPVLEDDALLFSMTEEDEDEESRHTDPPENDANTVAGLLEQANVLRRENLELKRKFKQYFEDESAAKAPQFGDPEAGLELVVPDSPDLAIAGLKSPAHGVPHKASCMSLSMASNVAPLAGGPDASFSRTEYDKAWVQMYERLLSANAPVLMKGKRVLDVNCGFGVSSMLASKCGLAKHVVAYEPQDLHAASMLSKIVERNQFDSMVTVATTAHQLEDITDEEGRFEVLLFPWSTACLLPLESLTRMIHCRDQYVERQAVVLPDMYTMHAAGFCVTAANLLNTTSFDFTPFCEDLRQSALSSNLALHQSIPQQGLSTYSVKFKTFDLTKALAKDLEFTETFVLNPFLADSKVSGIVMWFESVNSPRFCTIDPVSVTSSPSNPAVQKLSHLRQTVFYLPKDLFVGGQSPATKQGTPIVFPPGIIGTKDRPAASLRVTVTFARNPSTTTYLKATLAVVPCLAQQDGEAILETYYLPSE
eukprot:TRINITY_DN31824_c0_g1_i2.p1 TRINITY_DN31824_c0_g1~~TRINITY_DN31824_c0_g1_i2.p1  ORF type:complete len:607 (+),score=215.83 TRINITY_DN31824_c0_g1_i2:99-1823(+)